MKEGWEKKTLKEVSTLAGDYGLSVSSKPFDGVRYLRITDITDWGDLNEDMVSANVDSDKKQEKLEEGDILFARTGATVGKTLVYKKEFGECLFAGYLIRYRLNKDIILPRYMYYVTHSKEYYDWVFVNQEAAAQPNISAKKYNLLPIKYPSLSEQQRIVSRLDSAFAHIDELKANAEKQLSEARALFQKALTKAMEPKEGWEEKKFKDLCSFVRGPFGGSLKKNCFVPSGYAVYEQQNAIYNKFSFRYFIDEEKYNSMIRFSVTSGDLIMSCSGTIGKVAIVPEGAAKGIINQALLKLSPKKVLDKYYLKYLMESSFFDSLIAHYSDGAAIKNIASVAILKEIELSIPPLSEQQRIVSRLDSLSAHVRELEEVTQKTIAECDALKQALLRKVFE